MHHALTRIAYILISMVVQVTRFDQFIKDYPTCGDYSVIYSDLIVE